MYIMEDFKTEENSFENDQNNIGIGDQVICNLFLVNATQAEYIGSVWDLKQGLENNRKYKNCQIIAQGSNDLIVNSKKIKKNEIKKIIKKPFILRPAQIISGLVKEVTMGLVKIETWNGKTITLEECFVSIINKKR